MKSKVIFLLFILLFICGCDKKISLNHKIIFQDQNKINYSKDIQPLDFIASVDGMQLNSIEDNKAYISTFYVECMSKIERKKGNQKLTYQIGNQKYYFTICIVDTESPIINLTHQTYTIKEGDSLRLEDIKYTVEDNFDEIKDIKVSLINDNQKYYIQAADKSGNISKEELMVEIKKSQKKEDKANQENNSSKDKNNKNASHNSTNNQENKNENEKKSSDKKDSVSIQYHFEFGKKYKLYKSDGTYDIVTCDMSNAMQICSSHLSQSGKSGQCIPVMNVDKTLYTGYELILD